MLEVILNSDKTRATIHCEERSTHIDISPDGKSAVVHFVTHSVGFSTDSGKVWDMIWEIVIAPSLALIRFHQIMSEDTVEINVDGKDAA